jgi:hypothetical protein
VSEWELIPNPEFTGPPRILTPTCHDRSPFITVVHGCGGEMHFHETQLGPVPLDAEIAAVCKSCGELMVFPPGYFHAAFQQLRDEGWIE